LATIKHDRKKQLNFKYINTIIIIVIIIIITITIPFTQIKIIMKK
jgi:hypothetical protein